MPKTRPPYSSEFRRQMVELVRAGRDPADLAREFEPSAQAIRNWVVQADRQEGRREVKPVADALGTPEREAWRARRHGPDYGAKCVSSGWSVTFSQNPRPGSPARPARCRPGLPVHEREPGYIPCCCNGARARCVEGGFLCVAAPPAIRTHRGRRGAAEADQDGARQFSPDIWCASYSC